MTAPSRARGWLSRRSRYTIAVILGTAVSIPYWGAVFAFLAIR